MTSITHKYSTLHKYSVSYWIEDMFHKYIIDASNKADAQRKCCYTCRKSVRNYSTISRQSVISRNGKEEDMTPKQRGQAMSLDLLETVNKRKEEGNDNGTECS